jgi:ornithine decarboxylase
MPADPFNLEVIKRLDYPTPYLLFSKQRLTETVNSYARNLPGVEIFYALKSNSHPDVISAIAGLGCGFEAASAYELEFLKRAQVPASRILFGTAVKPASHIKQFSDYGVERFAFDSEQELDKIAAVVPNAKVYARILVDDTDSVFTMSEKFGAPADQAVALLTMAKQKGLAPYGLSFNVGSQARNSQAWANGIISLIPAIKQLSDQGIRLEMLNLGGGYPYSYLENDGIPSIDEIATHIKQVVPSLPYPLQLFIEPGRGLVADSMALVVSVFAKIKRGSGHWLYVDAGAYNALLETMAYQGSIRYQVSALEESAGSPMETYILTGPTGDSLDVIDKQISLPADLKIGDKLLIHDTGAYSLVLASPFNGFPPPPVYDL